MKYFLIPLFLIGFMGSTIADSTVPSATIHDVDFTASTFFDKYRDLLQKGGARVSVLIKVAGDIENTDPVKRAKEIRNMQSSVLKFLSFSNGINILSNPQKNEITGQIHPQWIEILEERTDVLSVTILDQFELSKDGVIPSPLKQIKAGVALVDIKCIEGKNLVYKYNRMRAACVSEETEGKLLSRGWAALRLGLPHTDNLARDLCNFYEGTWIDEHSECVLLEDELQCSLMGGTYNECASACRNMPKDPDLMCTDNCVVVCYFEKSSLQITNFEECVNAGNPVMESYPRQCRTPDGKHFVETISDPLSTWNDGNSKQKILEFVDKVTNPSSSSFVPILDRIATFDNDGTLDRTTTLHPFCISSRISI